VCVRARECACVCVLLWQNTARPPRCCATNRKVAGSIPAGVSGFFIDIKSFRSHYGTGVDSASNRNEYQEYFLGGKGGRCVRLTTYLHPVPLSWNLRTLTSWNPLGLSRPVMGVALHFYSQTSRHNTTTSVRTVSSYAHLTLNLAQTVLSLFYIFILT